MIVCYLESVSYSKSEFFIIEKVLGQRRMGVTGRVWSNGQRTHTKEVYHGSTMFYCHWPLPGSPSSGQSDEICCTHGINVAVGCQIVQENTSSALGQSTLWTVDEMFGQCCKPDKSIQIKHLLKHAFPLSHNHHPKMTSYKKTANCKALLGACSDMETLFDLGVCLCNQHSHPI